jgi:hypothetical protein
VYAGTGAVASLCASCPYVPLSRLFLDAGWRNCSRTEIHCADGHEDLTQAAADESQGASITQRTTSALRVGLILEIAFPPFTPRITIISERELTVQIVAGDNAGFTGTVDYEAVELRDGLVMLSWQKHIGSTIVHVLDLAASTAHTAVTPATGGFMRPKGPITVIDPHLRSRVPRNAVVSYDLP